jgi:radical SAM superfamily enzyme YgiQ (UPF0313 family)
MPMRVILLSTYDLGRQPFGLASPAAWLRRAGLAVVCADLARERITDEVLASADVVAVHLPMHTATRLALPVISRIHERFPAIRLVAYGLYALPNAGALRASGVETVLGPEYEEALVKTVLEGRSTAGEAAASDPGVLDGSQERAPRALDAPLPRFAFLQPDRAGLPPLARYASLQMPDGSRRVTGYTEASRGCKHRCRHCPVVPVYDGRFRVVAPDVVLGDISAQVAGGAQHITFGDPDFLNGPRHAERIVRALSAAHPGLTYDVTVKIEHILRHPDVMRTLAETGCLFVTSAVEAVDDDILGRLDKGHTRGDFERAVAALRVLGLPMVPTFVAFTPWTTREGYVELLETLDRLELVEQVAPIQLGIRLLIPEGSRLLELDDVRRMVRAFDARLLAYPWRHPDDAMDALQQQVTRLVGRRIAAPRREVFEAVRALAYETAGRHQPPRPDEPRAARATVPYLNEPWYC